MVQRVFPGERIVSFGSKNESSENGRARGGGGGAGTLLARLGGSAVESPRAAQRRRPIVQANIPMAAQPSAMSGRYVGRDVAGSASFEVGSSSVALASVSHVLVSFGGTLHGTTQGRRSQEVRLEPPPARLDSFQAFVGVSSVM